MFICVAGKNNIAVEVLDYVKQNYSKGNKLGIVCNKTETGKSAWQKSLREYASINDIPEYSLADLYSADDLLFLSMEFDRIVKPEKFINARLYNIHFSLLPQYKGMYTSALPILHGVKTVGVTLHCIDSGIDTGDIIAQKAFEIQKDWTSRDLYGAYIQEGIELVKANMDSLVKNTIKPYPQPSEGSTYFSKKAIDYSNLTVDLHQTAEGIQRQIRAFSFKEYQLPIVFDKKIAKAQITSERSFEKPGTILYQDSETIKLATIDYVVILHIDKA